MRETDGGTRQSESDTDITDLDGEAWLVKHGWMVGWQSEGQTSLKPMTLVRQRALERNVSLM